MSVGRCFVCLREGVVLEAFVQHDGRLVMVCADQQACLAAYAKRFPRKPKASKAARA